MPDASEVPVSRELPDQVKLFPPGEILLAASVQSLAASMSHWLLATAGRPFGVVAGQWTGSEILVELITPSLRLARVVIGSTGAIRPAIAPPETAEYGVHLESAAAVNPSGESQLTLRWSDSLTEAVPFRTVDGTGGGVDMPAITLDVLYLLHPALAELANEFRPWLRAWVHGLKESDSFESRYHALGLLTILAAPQGKPVHTTLSAAGAVTDALAIKHAELRHQCSAPTGALLNMLASILAKIRPFDAWIPFNRPMLCHALDERKYSCFVITGKDSRNITEPPPLTREYEQMQIRRNRE